MSTLSTTVGGLWLGPDTHSNRPATPLGGTLYVCTTHSKIEKYDSGAWADWATLSSGTGLTAILAVKAQRTAGDVTINSTSFVDIATATDLTIAAAAGDLIELGMEIRASVTSGSFYCVMDFHTMVSGTPVNSVSSASAAGSTTSPGLPGWSTGTVLTAAQGYTRFSGRQLYTVQSGDIASGNVTFRLRGFSSGSVTLAATDPKLYVQAINLKH